MKRVENSEENMHVDIGAKRVKTSQTIAKNMQILGYENKSLLTR